MSFVPQNVSKDALLSYLRPLSDVGIFPLPTGWNVVAGVAGVVFLLLICRHYGKRARRKRRVMAVFKEICGVYERNGDVSVLCADISVLIRRVVRITFRHQPAATLSDDDWITFLQDTGAVLDDDAKYFLKYQAYAPAGTSKKQDKSVERFLAAVRGWFGRVL